MLYTKSTLNTSHQNRGNADRNISMWQLTETENINRSAIQLKWYFYYSLFVLNQREKRLLGFWRFSDFVGFICVHSARRPWYNLYTNVVRNSTKLNRRFRLFVFCLFTLLLTILETDFRASHFLTVTLLSTIHVRSLLYFYNGFLYFLAVTVILLCSTMMFPCSSSSSLTLSFSL